MRGHIEVLVGMRALDSVDTVLGSLPKKAARAQAGVERALNQTGRRAAQDEGKTAEQGANRRVAAETRAVLAIARMRSAAEDRLERQRITAEKAVQNEQKRTADAEIRAIRRREAEGKRLEAQRKRAAKDQELAAAREERYIARSLGYRTAYHGIIRYAPGAMHHGARMANDMLRGAGINFDMGASFERNVELGKEVRHVRSQAMLVGESGLTGSAIDKQIRATALARGFSNQEVAAGVVDFGKTTGAPTAALGIAPEILKRAGAASSSPEEMMALAGDIYSHLGEGVKDKQKATLGIIDAAIMQGAKGSLEIGQQAKLFPKIGAAAGGFEGDEGRNIVSLGALAQLARKTGGASSAAEAFTSVSRFSNQLKTAARVKQFKAAGVEVYSQSEPGKLRDPMAILRDVITHTAGDPLKMNKMLMSTVASKPAEALRLQYINARNEAARGGASKADANAAGMKAMNAAIEKFTNVESVKSSIEKLDAERMESPDVKAQQFMSALDGITQGMMARTLPQLEKLGPRMLQLADIFGKTVSWAAENPWKAIMATIGLSLARAGLESVVRLGLEKAISAMAKYLMDTFRGGGGGGGAPALPGGGVAGRGGFMAMPGGGAMAGAAFTGLALGAAVGAGIYAKGTSDYSDTTAKTDEVSKNLAKVDESDPAALSQAILEAKAKLKKIKDDRGMFGGMMDFFGAGNSAEIGGLEDLIARREKELNFGGKAGGGPGSPAAGAPNGPQQAQRQVSVKAELDTGQLTQGFRAAWPSVQRVEIVNLPPPGSALSPPTVSPAGRQAPVGAR